MYSTLAVEVTASAVSCNTVMVSYTVNPLPGGGNEATLRSLEVSYRPILGSGSSGTRSVALNGNTMEGILCLSGLPTNTPYRVTYSVEVNTGMSTGLPSDLSAPAELLAGGICNSQQCLVVSRTRTVTSGPPTTSCTILPSTTLSSSQPSTTSSMGDCRPSIATFSPTESSTTSSTATPTTAQQGECRKPPHCLWSTVH